MIIEIKGVNFKNKGAELMLHAILHQVKRRYDKVKFVMKPSHISPYEERAKLGMFQKLEFQKFNLELGLLSGKVLPRAFREFYGLIKEDEIDVILDASGLAYSDKWGVNLTKNAAQQFKRMKSNGTKIVLLPQAFGPFNNDDLKRQIINLSKNTDLIYARDQISHDILTTVVGKVDHVKIAPDFTNLIKGIVPDTFRGKEGSICIIPNYRMIDKTEENVSNKYIPFISNIIKELHNVNENVFLLIHEGKQDLNLAKRIISMNGLDIEIITESNPLKIKGIISECKGIVSSRFHGLVSALSQGVPALGTGWSHKYEMLYKDYDFEEGLLRVNMTEKEISDKLKFLTNSSTTLSLNKHLLSRSEIIKSKSESMWEEVFQTIT